jgi:hypothetical protein
MNTPKDERRNATRQVLRTKAKLVFAQGLVLDARTLNVSTTGMAIATDGPMAPGTSFALRCYVPVNGARMELVTQVRVVHSVFSSSEGGFVIGLLFSGQSPEAASLVAAVLAVK